MAIILIGVSPRKKPRMKCSSHRGGWGWHCAIHVLPHIQSQNEEFNYSYYQKREFSSSHQHCKICANHSCENCNSTEINTKAWRSHCTNKQHFKDGYKTLDVVFKMDKIEPAARFLKITEKVSFNIASKASYVYILSGQKLFKNAQNGPFWRVFENLKLAVKQCYQIGQL